MCAPIAKSLVLVALFLVGINAQPSQTCVQVTCPDGSTSPGRITVTGTGSFKNMPDTATLSLAVSVTRPNATVAREDGAKAVNATLAALTTAGIPKAQVTTGSISLNPVTNYDPVSSKPSNDGYMFTESIDVKLYNVTNDSLSSLIDAVILAGGDALQVQGVNTELDSVKNKDALNEARKSAVADALSAAAILAQASNVTLGPITQITDGNYSPPIPIMGAVSDAMAKPETPTQYLIGEAETQATVTIEVAICK